MKKQLNLFFMSMMIFVSSVLANTIDGVTSATPLSMTVTAPNGSEIWEVGTQQRITWKYSGSLRTVQIDYSIDNGQTWTRIASTQATRKSYLWTVPNTPGTTCKVRIQNSNGNPTDMSNRVFTIKGLPPVLKLASFNDGGIYTAGSQHEIKWDVENLTGEVTLSYSTDKGSSWNVITTTSASAPKGSYMWTLPNVTTTECLVKIASKSDPNVSVMSSASFTIEPAVSITHGLHAASAVKIHHGKNGFIIMNSQGRIDQIQLISYNGRVLMNTAINSQRLVIPYGKFSTGTYIIKGMKKGTSLFASPVVIK